MGESEAELKSLLLKVKEESEKVGCSLPRSSIHGILQARILEWVAIPFSRGPSQPRSPALQVDCSQNGHQQKNLQTINAGEVAEKRKPSYTVGGNINWYSLYGEL